MTLLDAWDILPGPRWATIVDAHAMSHNLQRRFSVASERSGGMLGERDNSLRARIGVAIGMWTGND